MHQFDSNKFKYPSPSSIHTLNFNMLHETLAHTDNGAGKLKE